MMRSANPALNNKTFAHLYSAPIENRMTIQGTVNKTFFLLGLLLIGAFYTWNQFYLAPESLGLYWIMGGIGSLVFALVTIFKPTLAPITGSLYAACKGLLLGGISAMFEARYPGIVIQAVLLTFCTLFALLIAYKSRLIKVTENFKLGLAAATGGIFMLYLVSFIMSFFGMSLGFIHGSSLIGIGFSLIVVVVAALNLVMDFDFIENGAERGAPKYMEWYGAFGLIVTLAWLYLEMLRLLMKLNSRR
jgi:uncharacterized YccA/Bax inhibitor family protein